MSRRGARTERRLPLFQIRVADFSKQTYNTVVVGSGRHRQKLDIPTTVPSRTICKPFKDGRAATRWASRFGLVISCFKVDTTPYLKNIEYLNLEQPLKFEVDREEYTLNKSLELSRRTNGEKKFDVEIVDNE